MTFSLLSTRVGNDLTNEFGPAAIRWCLGDLCVWVCSWRWKNYSCEYSERECRWVSGSDPSDYRLYRSPATSVSKPRKKKRQHAGLYRSQTGRDVCVWRIHSNFSWDFDFSLFFCLSVDCEMLCHWQMSTELKNNVFIDGLQFRIRKIGATEKDRTIKEPNPWWSRWAEDPSTAQQYTYIYPDQSYRRHHRRSTIDCSTDGLLFF